MSKVTPCLVLSLLLTTSASHARILSTGDQGSDQTEPAPTINTGTNLEDDKKYNEAAKKLSSLDPGNQKDALDFFSRQLTSRSAAGRLTGQDFQGIIALIGSDSVQVRREATRVLSANKKSLMDRGLLSPRFVEDLSRDVYNSETSLRSFIGLMPVLLPDAMDTAYFTSEYTFILLEGVKSKDKQTADTASALLGRYGPTMTDRLIWGPQHTRKYFQMFSEVPKEALGPYLQVLTQNLKSWADHHFVTKDDIESFRSTAATLPHEQRFSVTSALTDPKNSTSLGGLGYFDSRLADSIINDVKSSDIMRQQDGMELLIAYLPALKRSGAISQSDYDNLMDYVFENLDSFDDPLRLITAGASTLGKTQFARLLATYPDKTRSNQAKILDYIKTNYKSLSKRGLITNQQMTTLTALAAGDSRGTQITKMGLVENNPSLMHRVDSTRKLDEFLKTFAVKDPKIFTSTLRLFDDNLDVWIGQQIFNKDHLTNFIDGLEMGSTRTAAKLDVLNSHWSRLIPLLNTDMMDTLIGLTESARPEVAKAAHLLFEAHASELYPAKLMTKDVKSYLKETRIGTIRSDPNRRIH